MAYTSEILMTFDQKDKLLQLKKSQDKARLTIIPVVTGVLEEEKAQTFLLEIEDLDIVITVLKEIKRRVYYERSENQ